MGGRGIKRKKNKPKEENKPRVPKKQPKEKQETGVPPIPRKKKKPQIPKEGVGGFGGASGGSPVEPKKPKDEEKPKPPKQDLPTPPKTLRIGGIYYRLEDGKLTKIGSSKETIEIPKEGVEIKVGARRFLVDQKGNVKELQQNSKPKSVQLAELVNGNNLKDKVKLTKGTFEDYSGLPSNYIHRSVMSTIDRKTNLESQAENSVRLLNAIGVKMPTDEELKGVLRQIGMSEENIKKSLDFSSTSNINLYKFNRSDLKTTYPVGRSKRLVADSEIVQKGIKAHMYMVADSIRHLQNDILKDVDGLVTGFKINEGIFGVGGSMSSLDNTYGIPLNRLGLEHYTSKGETYNVDFTIPGVVTHEVGHAVYNKLHAEYGPSFDRMVEGMYNLAKKHGMTPSGYGNTNSHEFFAETFLGMIKYKYWGHKSENEGRFSSKNPVFDAMELMLKNANMLQTSSGKKATNVTELFDLDSAKALQSALEKFKK